MENVQKVVEDVLIYDMDLSTHGKRVKDVIQRCADHGITLNRDKFVFAKPQVDYCSPYSSNKNC